MVQQFSKFICYYMLYGAFRLLNLESVFWHSVNLSIVLGRHVPGNCFSRDEWKCFWNSKAEERVADNHEDVTEGIKL